jgi:hypothetical protein
VVREAIAQEAPDTTGLAGEIHEMALVISEAEDPIA